MSLLSYTQLHKLLDENIVAGIRTEHINSSSIDITLGSKLLIEKSYSNKDYGNKLPRVNLKERTPLNTIEYDLDKGSYFLHPGEFVLAQSEQMFFLPNNISAEYKLKSSMARVGLEHLNAGWCDAGWNGSVLTLELKNMTQNHVIVLDKGVGIGQMVFFKHEEVPADKSYAARGRYNKDNTVSGVKL